MSSSENESTPPSTDTIEQSPQMRGGFTVTRGALGWVFAGLTAALVFAAGVLVLHAWPTAQNMRTADHRFAAMSLLQGEGLVTARGEPYGKSAPIYPCLLAGLRLLGLEWWTAASVINALALAAGVLGVHAFSRLLGLRTSRWLIVAYLSFAPIYYLFREARPDIVFAACGIAAVALATAYVHRPGWGRLIALGAVCGVAALSRYMAIFALIPVVAAAILMTRHGSWRKKALHATLFVLIACAPIGAWLKRTENLTGHYTGMDRWKDRKPADESLITFDNNLRFMGLSFYLDFLAWEDFGQLNELRGLHPIEGSREVLTVASVLGLLLILLGLLHFRKFLATVSGWLISAGPPRTAGIIAAAYLAWYQLMMLALWTGSNNDPIDCRFLAPSYFMVVLVSAVVFTALWRSSRWWTARPVIIAVVAGFIGLQGWKTAATWEVLSENAASPWVEDPETFVAAMNKTNLEARIEERLADRGRKPGIPEKMRERLESKGKVLVPDEQKMNRVERLAEQIENDPTRKPKSSDAPARATEAQKAARAEERRQAKIAEADRRREKPEDMVRDAEPETASDHDRAPEPLPTLEHLRLTAPTVWQAYRPLTRESTLRMAFRISEGDRGKHPALAFVHQFDPGAPSSIDPLGPWLDKFTYDDDRRAEPLMSDLTIHGMPVHMAETTGTYKPEEGEELYGTCSLVGAVIEHPMTRVVVVAIGSRKTMQEQQDAVVAFLMSAESLDPLPSSFAATADDPAGSESTGGAMSSAGGVDRNDAESQTESQAEAPDAAMAPESRDVTFELDPPWESFEPKTPGASFRQGYFLDPVERTRTSARLVVSYVAAASPDPVAQIARWLKDFTSIDRQEFHEPPRSVSRQPSLPVTWLEATGAYAPPSWPQPENNYSVIGAAICAKGGMFLVKANGPQDQLNAARPTILAFIGSARGDAGESVRMFNPFAPVVPEAPEEWTSAERQGERPIGGMLVPDGPADPKPPVVEPLEYIGFDSKPPWPAYIPDEPNPNFRLGFVIAADRDDRPLAKITVGQAEGLCGTWDESTLKWLRGFSPSGGEAALNVHQQDLMIDEMPVLLLEVVGKYDGGDDPRQDTAMILAQIVHPQATYHVRAMGPARFILPERENILDYINSVRQLGP